MSSVTADRIGIRRLERAGELDLVEPLWVALHQHHRTVTPAGMLVADDAVSWQRRRALYREWLAAGDALILLAQCEGAAVGYAVAHLQDGPDDTFAVGERYAELYSLSVAPAARGAGVGTRLLDDLDRRLADDGILDLVVAVMAGNRDALRFYERRGLVPAETHLWRIAGDSRPG